MSCFAMSMGLGVTGSGFTLKGEDEVAVDFCVVIDGISTLVGRMSSLCFRLRGFNGGGYEVRVCCVDVVDPDVESSLTKLDVGY
jgi:hypothetical protein